MSPNHILDLRDNPHYNCLVRWGLAKTQPDFALIGFFGLKKAQKA